jgi:hypothetical protein
MAERIKHELQLKCGCTTYAQVVIGEEHFEIVGHVGYNHEPANDGITAGIKDDMKLAIPLVLVHSAA